MAKSRLKKVVATTLLLGLGFGITFFVMMLLSIVTDYGFTIASFGATILMILSKKKLSKKRIIGAYMLASFVGCICSLLPTMTSFNIALASVLAFGAMTFFNFQHAPAIGFAISMVLNKFSLWTDLFVALCIFMIIGMAWLLKTYLQDPDAILNFVHIETEKIKWDF